MRAKDEWALVERMMTGDYSPDQPRDENGRWAKVGTPQNEEEKRMLAELEEHFKRVNADIAKFMKMRSGSLDDINEEYPQIEKHSLKDIKKYYIDPFNETVSDWGDGFQWYDPDQVIMIEYGNGKWARISPDDWDGTKKIPTSNITNVIVDGGWGTAFAGKGIEVTNWRETTDYEHYGYHSIQQRYDDWDDIRVDFDHRLGEQIKG